jgi:hypothetical protein
MVLAMSRPGIDWVLVLRDVTEAARLMRIYRRQVFRLLEVHRAHGPKALVSTRRSKLDNRRYRAAAHPEALALIKASYADFGPTLACEKLTGRHTIDLGVVG